ncbi:MAG: FAD:protein FMN transferase [Anaerolineales bacterium]|nr:FAD:protein FMN transferase [Anaerolineales bacterium]
MPRTTLTTTRTTPAASWATHHFRAMGCHIHFWLDAPGASTAEISAALHAAEQQFHTAEQRLSRFRTTSELSRVNAQAGQWVAVSPLFWEVLVAAVQASAATDGLFDPTLQHALVAAGYDRSFEQLTTPSKPTPSVAHASTLGQWTAIELDEARQAVRVPAGVALDFGGIAKGYTAVLASRELDKVGPNLVSAGGDLTAGNAPHGSPGWPVGIADPFSPDKNLATLWLANASLATSGIDYRRWLTNDPHGRGRSAHHIIDPRTGQPANTDLLTVTVWHRSAIVAETWATAVLVAGKKEGLGRLAVYDIAAMLITPHNHITLSWAMEPLVYWPDTKA